MMTMALSVRDMTVAYSDTPVLWDIDADIPIGCMAAIIGPNGAGKSTFIKAALELTPKLTGEVRFFGQPLAAVRQKIAYVPQRAAIDWDFPITVKEVAVMGSYEDGCDVLAKRIISVHSKRLKLLVCHSFVPGRSHSSRVGSSNEHFWHGH
jgi:ABC-type Mn2+/Zn2+ transport system ATPase subunit